MELLSPAEFAKEKLQAVEDYSLLAAQSIANLFRHPRYLADMIQQDDLVGFGSLPVVVLTGGFTGAVLTLNSANSLQRFGSLSLLGQLVSVGMVRELGPVLTGLMVAGRNASGMASELGSMVVTEQIDAMRALGTDPIQKLVTPRLLATGFMLPLLTIIADFVGMFGGYIVAVFLVDLNGRRYWSTVWQALGWDDFVQGLLKPLVFAFVVALVGCYYGLRATGGTQGVGKATTQAVVAASVLIFVLTFFLTRIFTSQLVTSS